jgi:hypothetical protein
MTQSSKSAHPEISRALLWFSIAAIILSLPLLINIVGRVQAEAEMRAAVQQMTAQVDENKLKLVQLQEALDYAKSNAYTERWARVQAHWTRPGETVVISPATDGPPRLWWEAFLTQ